MQLYQTSDSVPAPVDRLQIVSDESGEFLGDNKYSIYYVQSKDDSAIFPVAIVAAGLSAATSESNPVHGLWKLQFYIDILCTSHDHFRF